MEMILCPSIFNLEFENLADEIKKLDEAGSDIIHFDVMDGHFVSNIGLSIQDLDVVRRATNKLIDVHMMVTDPIRYIELFAEHGADIIYIHPEADVHPEKTIAKIKECGKIPGIAINPGTSIPTVQELLLLVDYVCVMSVIPGKAGQDYLDFVEPKIMELVKLKKSKDFKIVVDGGVDKDVLTRLYHNGVEGFVLGNQLLFEQEEDYRTQIKKIREF